MSQVLVSSPPMPLVSPLPEAVDRSLLQQQLQLSANPVCMEEKRMASQLAYLASQHHASEYNRLKFGPSGAPIMYIPLSIQLPDQVRELKARQVQHSQQRAWWPAKTSGETPSDLMDMDPLRNHVSKYPADSIQVERENIVPSPIPVHTPGPERLSPAHGKPFPTLNHLPTLNLQRELSVAMSSPLSIITIPQLSRVPFQQPNLNTYAKTSESHPINISPIVPFELLPLITSHLACAPQHASQMFDLPPSLLLHHLIAHSPAPPTESVRSYPLMRVTNSSLPFPMNGVTQPAPTQFPLGAYGMPEPVLITTESSIAAQDGNVRHSSNWLQRYGEPDITKPSESLALEPDQQSTSISPPISALSSPYIQDRRRSAPSSLLPLSLVPPENNSNGVITSSPSLPEVVCAMSSDILAGVDNAEAVEKAAVSQPVVRDISSAWARDAPPTFVPSLRPALGNMLLSSCPGKKVRLSGPVKGRGAICRDLGHDLRRVKALGVGCIICCLDDEELEFLGASWPQYSEIAQAVGLDILRVPIPEGLSPPTPALFDQHLSYIIHSYTLQGIPVLVHCRGGVGRAGLVACCWMLKLGLCGRIDSAVEDYIAHPVTESGDAVVKVRRDTLELVERVIGVVRRRRSVKAIETYEQVRFLVEFVEHLKARSGTPKS